MQLVLTINRSRTRHSHSVLVSGTTLGHCQVIPAVSLIQVRCFRDSKLAAFKDVFYRTCQPACSSIEFLQQNTIERRMSRVGCVRIAAVIPDHI